MESGQQQQPEEAVLYQRGLELIEAVEATYSLTPSNTATPSKAPTPTPYTDKQAPPLHRSHSSGADASAVRGRSRSSSLGAASGAGVVTLPSVLAAPPPTYTPHKPDAPESVAAPVPRESLSSPSDVGPVRAVRQGSVRVALVAPPPELPHSGVAVPGQGLRESAASVVEAKRQLGEHKATLASLQALRLKDIQRRLNTHKDAVVIEAEKRVELIEKEWARVKALGEGEGRGEVLKALEQRRVSERRQLYMTQEAVRREVLRDPEIGLSMERSLVSSIQSLEAQLIAAKATLTRHVTTPHTQPLPSLPADNSTAVKPRRASAPVLPSASLFPRLDPSPSPPTTPPKDEDTSNLSPTPDPSPAPLPSASEASEEASEGANEGASEGGSEDRPKRRAPPGIRPPPGLPPNNKQPQAGRPRRASLGPTTIAPYQRKSSLSMTVPASKLSSSSSLSVGKPRPRRVSVNSAHLANLIGHSSPEHIAARAFQCQVCGRVSEASVLYSAAYALQPSSTKIATNYALFLYRCLNKNDEAQAVFEQAMALLPLPGSETPAPPPGSTDATTTTPQPGSETSEGAQPGSEATEGALPGSSTVPLPGSTATPSLPPGSEASEGTVPGSSASQSSLLPGSEDRAGMAKLASNYAIFLSRIKGDNAEAHTLHQRAVELCPEDASAWGNYARFVEVVKEDVAQAEQLYTHALRLEPTHAVTLLAYARLLARTQRHKDAQEIYRRALCCHPSNVSVLATLASFLLHTPTDDEAEGHSGAEEEAKRLLEEALRIQPNHPGVKRNYESLLARQGLSKDPIPITTHLITAPTDQETEAQLAERMKQPPPKPSYLELLERRLSGESPLPHDYTTVFPDDLHYTHIDPHTITTPLSPVFEANGQADAEEDEEEGEGKEEEEGEEGWEDYDTREPQAQDYLDASG